MECSEKDRIIQLGLRFETIDQISDLLWKSISHNEKKLRRCGWILPGERKEIIRYYIVEYISVAGNLISAINKCGYYISTDLNKLRLLIGRNGGHQSN